MYERAGKLMKIRLRTFLSCNDDKIMIVFYKRYQSSESFSQSSSRLVAYVGFTYLLADDKPDLERILRGSVDEYKQFVGEAVSALMQIVKNFSVF